MEIGHPFRAITPTIDGDILGVLARIEIGLTTGDILRLVDGRSESGIRKALERLVGQGLVTAVRVGHAYLYEFNRQHLLAPHVVAIAEFRRTFIEHLQARLETWAIEPHFAALFGSANRGDMGPDSDIDLFIVRPERVAVADDWREQLLELEAVVSGWTGNDARVLEMSTTELRGALGAGDPVVLAIKEEGTVLYGRRLTSGGRKGA